MLCDWTRKPALINCTMLLLTVPVVCRERGRWDLMHTPYHFMYPPHNHKNRTALFVPLRGL